MSTSIGCRLTETCLTLGLLAGSFAQVAAQTAPQAAVGKKDPGGQQPGGPVGPAQQNKAGNKADVITITALGDKLIVTSEDRAALGVVAELVRLLTSSPGAAGDFHVMRLKHASAVDAARILDEVFNGAKPGGGFGGGKGGKGGGKGGQFTSPAAFENFAGAMGGFPGPSAVGLAAGARVERIRVVADPATNALLVKASPLDMLIIRQLIDKQLDGGFTDAQVIIKTHPPIRLANMHVTDAYYILRDLFRESMDNNARGGRVGDGIASLFTGDGRAPVLNIDANGNPKGVVLSLSYDNHTNSLLVASPQPMYEDIKKLLGQMDATAANHKQIVKFIRVPGVDPAVIQQALDAIQGRASMTRANGAEGGMNGAGANRAANGGNAFGQGAGLGGGFPGGGGFFPAGGFNNSSFMPGPGFGGGGFGNGAKGPD